MFYVLANTIDTSWWSFGISKEKVKINKPADYNFIVFTNFLNEGGAA